MEYYIILEHATRDAAVKCLLWTAAGERSFGSGADFGGKFEVHLDEEVRRQYMARGMSPAYHPDDMNRMADPPDMALKRMTIAFWDFPKPIVGAGKRERERERETFAAPAVAPSLL